MGEFEQNNERKTCILGKLEKNAAQALEDGGGVHGLAVLLDTGKK